VSLGTVFDFSSAQRPANLVTLAPPILGDRVQVTAAYLGYLGAAGFAIAIFVLAFGGPSIERHTRALRAWWAWRRPGAGPIGAGTPTTGAASLGEPAEPVKAAIARVLGRRS
jgi:hypothetical protein